MRRAILACAAALLAAGCATPRPGEPPSEPPGIRYRCEQGFDFSVLFLDDSAVLDAGPRGQDFLLRDAGGTTPRHTVWSNPRMRAEFGLGAGEREALLHYPLQPLTVRCVRG
ncbi:hypothetical protein [Ramlibacter tataouinensis]|uniref:hypothetical protein n=1 Tax=Ramlibacter tataouinensis TaxID=94132 RepID=UPI000311A8BF|nr:hypothetical protein [Ramlibacter tataouinensis]